MSPQQGRYRLLVKNMPDAFAYHQIVTDSEGSPVDYIFLDINPAFEEMTGLKRNEILGKKATEVLPGIEESNFDWIGTFGRVALIGESVRLEHFFEPLACWFEITAYSGEPGYFVVILRDISTIKNAQKELQKSEQQLRNVIESQSELIGRDSQCKDCASIRALETKKAEQVDKYIPELGTYFNCYSNPLLDDDGSIVLNIEQIRGITDWKQLEEALRESEKKYRLISENVSDVIWTTDMHFNFTYVSPSVEQLCKYTVEEVMLLSFDKIFTPSSLKLATQALEEEIAGDQSKQKEPDRTRTLELEQVCKDGSTVWVEIKATFLRDQHGHPNGILGITRDITERKRAEEALRDSEERFRYLADFSPLPLVIIDQEGNFGYINPSFTEVFGYTLTDVPDGKAWFRLAYPDPVYRREVIDAWVRDLKDCGEGKVRPRIFKVTCKNGLQKEILFRPVLMDNGKHLLTCEDITERRRAEEALRESEDKYRNLFNQSVAGIYLHDFEGRMLDVNEVACLQSGYSRDELLKLTVFDLHADKAETVKLSKDEILRKWKNWQPGQRFTLEAEHQRKDGTIFPVQVSTGIVSYGDKKLMLGIVQDITERKQAEQKIADYTRELERLYRQLGEEMDKARQVHERTMPKALPAVEGVSFAACYQPAAHIGGDFYNVLGVENKIIIYLSDVTGHGLDGALLSVFIKEAIDSYITLKSEDLRPGKILEHLDYQYRRENYPEEYFISIFLAVLDLETMELSYAAAGFQDMPLVRMGNGRQLKLFSRGLFISPFLPAESIYFHESSIHLNPGTTIFFNTDGLTEQGNNGVYYMERLPLIFYENAHLPLHLIARAVCEDFRQFNDGSLQGKDDITFLVLQVEPHQKETYRLELASDFNELKRLRKSVSNILSGYEEANIFITCLYELAANAMEHGNRLDRGKSVFVEITVTDEYVQALVEDQGEGFDWRAIIDSSLDLNGNIERGRGIAIARKCCKHLLYNEKGNQATLVINTWKEEN